MLSKLKNPYSDELMIGLSQDIYNLNLSGKYIHRKGRDEVILSSRKVENLDEVDGYSSIILSISTAVEAKLMLLPLISKI